MSKSLEELLASAEKAHRKFEFRDPVSGQLVVKTTDSPADIAGGLEALRIWQGSRGVAPNTPPPAAIDPPIALPMLAERIELFIKQFNQKKRAATNKLDTAFTLRLFLGLIEDKPLAHIKATDMDVFLDAINVWPPNASKKKVFIGLTPSEVVAKAKELGGETISERTQEKHLDRLRVFFNWCVERVDITKNPAKTLHIMTREQEDAQARRPFTETELATIFDPVFRAKCDTPAKWWIPLIGLYTGARVSEIANLNGADVEMLAGVYGFKVHGTKNANAKRWVPIHPVLLDAGLIEYKRDVVERFGETTSLFPGIAANAGDSIGDWFNRTYLRGTCGIDDEMVFHCFRNTFSTQASRYGIPDTNIALITGHAHGGSILRRHYIQPAEVPQRHADVSAVAFPQLPTIPPYERGWFAEHFAKRARMVRHQAAKAKRTKC